jgi:signal peptidase I
MARAHANNKRESIRDISSIALMLVIVSFVAMSYVVRDVDFYKISGNGMQPELKEGDLVVASRPTGNLSRFDSAIFWLTRDELAALEPRPGYNDLAQPYVAKVFGLPSESVEFRTGSVLINGAPLAALNDNVSSPARRVPLNRYFVMVDRAITDFALEPGRERIRGWTNAFPQTRNTHKILRIYRSEEFNAGVWMEIASGALALIASLVAVSFLRARSISKIFARTIEIIYYLIAIIAIVGGILAEESIAYGFLIFNASLLDFANRMLYQYPIFVLIVFLGSMQAGIQAILSSRVEQK